MSKQDLLDDLNKIILEKKYVSFTNVKIVKDFTKIIRQAVSIVKEDENLEFGEDKEVKTNYLPLSIREAIPPGTILIFNYEDEEGTRSIRKVLTVKCHRIKTNNRCVFKGKYNNNLMAAYDLNTVTAEELSDILDKLHEDNTACVYQKDPDELKKIVPSLKENEFRTFDVDRMTTPHKLSILDKDKTKVKRIR